MPTATPKSTLAATQHAARIAEYVPSERRTIAAATRALFSELPAQLGKQLTGKLLCFNANSQPKDIAPEPQPPATPELLPLPVELQRKVLEQLPITDFRAVLGVSKSQHALCTAVKVGLADLPQALKSFPNLEQIELTEPPTANAIHLIARQAGKLRALDFSNQPVRTAELNALKQHDRLRALVTGLRVSRAELSALPGSFPNLKTLKLIHPRLEDINTPDSLESAWSLDPTQAQWKALFQLGQLVKLDCSHAALLQLPNSISQLKNLEILDCTGNPLGILPDAILELHNLKELHCSNSDLTRLPENIGQLRKLETLNCAHHHLRELPESIGQLQQLTTLNFGSNSHLWTASVNAMLNPFAQAADDPPALLIPTSITRLKKLQHLDCSGNALTTLPDDLGKLESLETLNCSNNKLNNLPASIKELARLKNLNCSDNAIYNILAIVRELPQVSNMQITQHLPPQFFPF